MRDPEAPLREDRLLQEEITVGNGSGGGHSGRQQAPPGNSKAERDVAAAPTANGPDEGEGAHGSGARRTRSCSGTC